jgi:Dolichyl-phosphate-mannose-protein mannosyltransferase
MRRPLYDRRVGERRFRWLLGLAIALATLEGLALIVLASNHLSSDSPAYLAEARALLHGNFSTPTPGVGVVAPDLYRTPGYPLLLAAAGGGRAGISRDVLYVYQLLLFAGTVWLTALTARRLWGDRPALIGAFLFALDPFSKRYVALVLSEDLAGFLVAFSAFAFVRAAQGRSTRWWAVAGAGVGTVILVRPAMTIALVLGPFAAVALAGPGSRSRAVSGTVFAACGLLVLAPWLLRNTLIVGTPALASWGPGESLLIGAYNEGYRRPTSVVFRDPGFRRDFRPMTAPGFYPSAAAIARHPDERAKAELRWDGRLRRRALHRYLHDLRVEPVATLGNYLYRAYFVWAVHDDPDQQRYAGAKLRLVELVVWATSLLAVVGAALAVVRRGPGAALVAFMAIYTLVSAVGHVEPRYSMPLRGLFFGLVGVAVTTLFGRGSGRLRNGAQRRVAR